jgi:hypothetical protein
MTEQTKHDRIFLQAIDDDDFFYPARGYEDDVEYIRADIVAEQLAELLKEANQQLAAKDALLNTARELISRYRFEITPGRQPHMICLEAEDCIAAIDKELGK